AWAAFYWRLQAGRLDEPILSFRDGGEFMIIRERHPGGDTANHRLEGASRQIYLFCGHHRPLKHVIERFPHVAADKIIAFLEKMSAQHLMFAENDHFLSLAAPVRNRESISIQ
ncbi:MAG: hypothetical protein ACM3KE_17935, partial [Hyphomicrobiales bacterium]